jgi:hypothetical protein
MLFALTNQAIWRLEKPKDDGMKDQQKHDSDSAGSEKSGRIFVANGEFCAASTL